MPRLTNSTQTLRTWWKRKTPLELWHHQLVTAESFEDWEEAALQLDNLLGLDLWYVVERESCAW
jgi:TAG lipase/lysophosphatidylethanolamine acyltransferase